MSCSAVASQGCYLDCYRSDHDHRLLRAAKCLKHDAEELHWKVGAGHCSPLLEH
jgi:hypothetical protein